MSSIPTIRSFLIRTVSTKRSISQSNLFSSARQQGFDTYDPIFRSTFLALFEDGIFCGLGTVKMCTDTEELDESERFEPDGLDFITAKKTLKKIASVLEVENWQDGDYLIEKVQELKHK